MFLLTVYSEVGNHDARPYHCLVNRNHITHIAYRSSGGANVWLLGQIAPLDVRDASSLALLDQLVDLRA